MHIHTRLTWQHAAPILDTIAGLHKDIMVNVQRPSEEETDDQALVDALRRGDAAAFMALVDRYHEAMVRLAMAFVGSRAIAEDVAQDAWLGVLRGLPTFEGRSSLKTWIFRILTNRAKTRGVREGRSIPFSDLWSLSDEAAEPAVPADRFQDAGDPLPGDWRRPPGAWSATPDDAVLAAEIRDVIDMAIRQLPPSQASVITLRDLEGWPALETCNILQISESNQRVLLHRARARVRQALEAYLDVEKELS
jgi:RNA polymerase sigma-70 factor (ECF subfamily)